MTLEKKYTQVRNIVVGENDLLTWCKEHGEEGQIIIKEWDQNKNGSMSQYKAGSNKKVNWICSLCGEPYVKDIRSRVIGRIHEPCGRKRGLERLKQFHKEKITTEKSLEGVYPELLIEWNYEENSKLGYEPKYLSAYSSKRVSWICKSCGYKWKAQIRMRSKFGYGCKACRKSKIS